MKQLNKYVLINEDMSGIPMILYTEYPFPYASIVTFNDGEVEPMPKSRKIRDFRAVVLITGSLAPGSMGVSMLDEVLDGMAEYARRTVFVERGSMFRKCCEDRELIVAERKARRARITREQNERRVEKIRAELFNK